MHRLLILTLMILNLITTQSLFSQTAKEKEAWQLKSDVQQLKDSLKELKENHAKELKAQKEALEKEFTVIINSEVKMLNSKIDWVLWVGSIIFALVGLIGIQQIRRMSKRAVHKRAKKEIINYIKNETFKEQLDNLSKDETEKILIEVQKELQKDIKPFKEKLIKEIEKEIKDIKDLSEQKKQFIESIRGDKEPDKEKLANLVKNIEKTKKDEGNYDAEDWLTIGYDYGIEGNHKEAAKAYAKAIELKPDYAAAYYNRGVTYYNLKEHDKAIKDYNKAIELKPDDATAYYNRGVAYADLKEHDKAIKDYTKAIELTPDDAAAYNNRGNAYADLKEHDKAIKDYTKVIELTPDDAEAYNNRGNAYSNLKEHDKAIKDYNKAIELKSDYANVYKNLAELYITISQYDDVLTTVERGLPYAETDRDKAILRYLQLIALKALNKKTADIEKEYNALLKKDFDLGNWDFDPIDKWFKTADLTDEQKRFIVEKGKQLKAHNIK